MDAPKMSPKDFFLYFGVAIALYASVGAVLAVLFRVIDLALPDALSYSYYQPSLSFPLAALIVAFPLYLVLTLLVRKDIAAEPDKYSLSVRKWFVWLTLFLAGAALAGDIIAVINAYLGGEVTMRFILKVIAVLAVAAAVFGYYLYDLRRGREGKLGVNRMLLGGAIFGVLAVIILALVVAGSPGEQRALRFDQRRVEDLSSIQWQILSHWQNKEVLPETLDELRDEFSGYVPAADPQTRESYEYRPTGTLSFELCATFSRPSQSGESRKLHGYDESFSEDFNQNFNHSAGRTCFERTIDPEKYPPAREQSGISGE